MVAKMNDIVLLKWNLGLFVFRENSGVKRVKIQEKVWQTMFQSCIIIPNSNFLIRKFRMKYDKELTLNE